VVLRPMWRTRNHKSVETQQDHVAGNFETSRYFVKKRAGANDTLPGSLGTLRLVKATKKSKLEGI
jgi:hypothetical protein